MLPGFRFLFAAIMLSMSLLIFGLGAAALLRAAHESFASNSTWHATPEVPFAQAPETTLPMLASLRVEPVAEKPAEAARIAFAPDESTPPATGPASSDLFAALKPVEAPAAEMAKPVEVAKPVEIAKPVDAPASMPAPETPPAPEAAPAAPATTEAATSDETKTPEIETPEIKTAAVATSDTEPARDEPAKNEPVKSEPVKIEPVLAQPEAVAPAPAHPPAVTSEATETLLDATEAESGAATTKIATLGGPPVDVAGPRKAKPARDKADQSLIRKRAQARRAARRRRLAELARLAALQQLQAYPFGQQPQPFPSAAPAAPR